jgi:Holliday junction resolvasome RuvABC ATP-dependent DNA helicase subunit
LPLEACPFLEIIIDFKKVSFLFATTERDKIFSPLLDRLSIITFDDYTYNEVAEIIQVNSGIKVCNTVLNELASYCRGNARSAQRMGRHITKYAEVMESKKFGIVDIASLVDTLSLFPLGLNQQEFNILKVVSENKVKGIALGNLCSKTGFDARPQQSMEKYLLKHGLIEIEGRRKITAKGIAYLEDYNNGK